ncbi:hypothetical protein [Kordia sp.]|uniref:hypothetical protein n=1 Tax=Kordia sp. TaxID=1965332 RepID=UPI003D6A185C
MEKLKYYRLNNSTDENEIGFIYAQDVIYQINDFIDAENNTEKRFEAYSDFFGSINEELDLTKFKALDQANMTDLMYSRFFWHECFYSQKFTELYKNFIVENSKLIPCKVHHKKNIHDYFLMHIEETNVMVDFEKSEFAIFDDLKESFKHVYEEKVTEDSFWDISRKIIADSENKLAIKPWKIVLNKPSDLFNLELNGRFYISNRFKEAIEKEKLTGFEFSEEPLKVEFYGNR